MKKNWEITRSEWPSVYIQKFSKFFATMHDFNHSKKKWKIDRASQDELLHTLRSVPWPPSCCLYQPTPFVGSDQLALAHALERFIPHGQSCFFYSSLRRQSRRVASIRDFALRTAPPPPPPHARVWIKKMGRALSHLFYTSHVSSQ